MSKQQRQLHFNLFATRFGHHPGAWRHPRANNPGKPDIKYWLNLARIAERGKFDAVFIADFAGIGSDTPEKAARRAPFLDFEPYTLTSAIAAVTEKIGVIATVNTNYDEPYNTARRFASLDHVSQGRAGWNIVSSSWESALKTFGVEQPLSHGERYERAAEYVDVIKALWDSSEDDALDHPDKARAIFADPSKLHPIHHQGKYFKVEGLLDSSRPVQGYPVFVQAGNSDTGIEFAAQYAEMTYAAAQTLPAAQRYYNDLKARMPKYGRDPDHLIVAPGISFSIAESDQEALDKFEELQNAVDLSQGVSLFGIDLSGYPLDGPFPELPATDNGKGRIEQVTALARRENLTIRQVFLRFATTMGHRRVIGTPAHVADQLEDWFVNRGADGYNLIPPLLPDSLEDFVNLVIPELQRRGLFRTEYQGSTLREHLGLPRPENQFRVATEQRDELPQRIRA